MVAKIRDLYREDTESVMDLSKGAELFYELHGNVYPAQFVSLKGCNNLYAHSLTLTDESSNSTKNKMAMYIVCLLNRISINDIEIQENSVRISSTGMQQMFLSNLFIFLMICEQKLHQSTSSREEAKV